MSPNKFLASIPQFAYTAEMVSQNEGRVAANNQISMYQLMENAGLAAFDVLQQEYPKVKTLLIVAGRGNNAGDGFVLARLALQQGMHVYVHSLSCKDEYQGGAKKACEKFLHAGGSFHKINEIDLNRVDVIVDALLGTGLTGKVKQGYGFVIDLLNQLETPILSLDIPSGLNANTGQIMGTAIKASVTVCFIAIKQGLLTGKASDHCGQLYFSGLGVEADFAKTVTSNVLLNDSHYLPQLAQRSNSAHKGINGYVGVVGGNRMYPGAIRLCAEGALRAGAGGVTVNCHQQNIGIVLANRPELMLFDLSNQHADQQHTIDKLKVVVIGPGLGSDGWADQLFKRAVDLNKLMVVDADGLNLLAQQPLHNDNWILTPHSGEAARLLNCRIADIEQDRFEAVRKIALTYGGVCVLKGAGTLISDGERVAINLTGNSGMAVAGMGDVLAGILGALILQSDNNFEAAQNGVYIHSRAADLAIMDGSKGLLASDLFVYIRQLVNQ